VESHDIVLLEDLPLLKLEGSVSGQRPVMPQSYAEMLVLPINAPERLSKCSNSNSIPLQPSRLLRIHLILRLIPAPRLNSLKCRLSPIHLSTAPDARNLLPAHRYIRAAVLELGKQADGLVAAEALAHVDHAALALTKPALELLAWRRQGGEEGLSEAFGSSVTLDHDTVGGLETLG
jgi:hypothetical protein